VPPVAVAITLALLAVVLVVAAATVAVACTSSAAHTDLTVHAQPAVPASYTADGRPSAIDRSVGIPNRSTGSALVQCADGRTEVNGHGFAVYLRVLSTAEDYG
jgi:hypothetical protein